jgi:hypothetical protein
MRTTVNKNVKSKIFSDRRIEAKVNTPCGMVFGGSPQVMCKPGLAQKLGLGPSLRGLRLGL